MLSPKFHKLPIHAVVTMVAVVAMVWLSCTVALQEKGEGLSGATLAIRVEWFKRFECWVIYGCFRFYYILLLL